MFNSDIFYYYVIVILIGRGYTQTTTANPENSPFPSTDPNASFEGQCVIVCDSTPLNNLNSQKFTTASGRTRRRVAFSVMRDSSLTSRTNDVRKTLLFNNVMADVGNSFDAEKGTFTPPVGGVYALEFNIYKLYNTNSLTVALTVNGNIKLTGFADGNTASHELARNSGILQLHEGDKVRIEVIDGRLDGGWKYSTFSGHLLYEDFY